MNNEQNEYDAAMAWLDSLEATTGRATGEHRTQPHESPQHASAENARAGMQATGQCARCGLVHMTVGDDDAAQQPVWPANTQDAIGRFSDRPHRRVDPRRATDGFDLDEVVHQRGADRNRYLYMHLALALTECVVDVGGYEVNKALVLASCDDATVRTITAWIVRAHLEGLRTAAAITVELADDLDGIEAPAYAAIVERAAERIGDAIDDVETRWSTR